MLRLTGKYDPTTDSFAVRLVQSPPVDRTEPDVIWRFVITDKEGNPPDEKDLAREMDLVPEGYKFLKMTLPVAAEAAEHRQLEGRTFRYLKFFDPMRALMMERIDFYAVRD